MTKKKASSPKHKTDKKIEHILVQNSADMQKIMIKLIERFERLSDKIDELLELFEDSAKILVKKEIESGKTENIDQELLEKINKIMDQNKIIAKGLTLVHDSKAEMTPKGSFAPSPKIEKDDFTQEEIKIPPFKKPISKQIKEEEKPVFEVPD